MNQKVCSKCGESRNRQEFQRRQNGRGRWHDTSVCRRCRKAQVDASREKYNLAHPRVGSQVGPAAQTEYRRQRIARDPKAERAREIAWRLGLDRNDVRRLLDIESCEICGSGLKLCVDHNHETGAIRGRLCNNCNAGIGFLGDDPARLTEGAFYLLRYIDSDGMIGYDNETW